MHPRPPVKGRNCTGTSTGTGIVSNNRELKQQRAPKAYMLEMTTSAIYFKRDINLNSVVIIHNNLNLNCGYTISNAYNVCQLLLLTSSTVPVREFYVNSVLLTT
jgi:hypothetical protein